MINIENLRGYYDNNRVFYTNHAMERIRERGIIAKDIRHAVMTGEIIEEYPNDYPYPSCLILGFSLNASPIHIVMNDEGSLSRIITAYFPNPDKWDENFKIRKE